MAYALVVPMAYAPSGGEPESERGDEGEGASAATGGTSSEGEETSSEDGETSSEGEEGTGEDSSDTDAGLGCERPVFANDFDDDSPGLYADLADWNDPRGRAASKRAASRSSKVPTPSRALPPRSLPSKVSVGTHAA